MLSQAEPVEASRGVTMRSFDGLRQSQDDNVASPVHRHVVAELASGKRDNPAGGEQQHHQRFLGVQSILGLIVYDRIRGV